MKRALFAALALLLAVALLELGSFVLLSLTAGQLRGPAELRRLMHSRVDEAVGDEDAETPEEGSPESEEDDAAAQAESGHLPLAPHPFLGYAGDLVGGESFGGRHTNREAAKYGFPFNRFELFREPSPEELVIGVFGGSFAAGFSAHLRENEEALAELERISGRRPVVLTFALGGYKQPQQLMALNYFLSLGTHLDVVVNLDGFNDVALAPSTNVRQRTSPYYPRDWRLMVDELDPETRRLIGEVAYLRQRRAEVASAFLRPPLSWSMTAGLWWTILDRRTGARLSRAELALAQGASAHRGRPWGPIPRYPDEGALYDDLAALWRRSSLLMDHLCRGAGIEYVHLLQPNQYVEGSKPLSAEERRSAWREDHPYRQPVVLGYPRLRAAGEELRRAGVEFVDLTDLFAGDETTLYRDSCCHVNQEGHARVARAVVAAIAAGRQDPAP